MPTNICVTCGRRLTWRRKLSGVRGDVRPCSDGCRRAGPKADKEA
nr:DUF2256 domain-containing protein [Roseovarius sp. M141]